MSRAVEVLRSRFGYDQFRFQQESIIETLIAGGDALVLMPTGDEGVDDLLLLKPKRVVTETAA